MKKCSLRSQLVFNFLANQRKRPSLVQMMGLQRGGGARVSARTKMGAKWLQKVKKGQVAPKGKYLI